MSTKSPDQLIEELSKIHPKGFDLSLGRITALLEKLGNPQKRISPAIHVAGTNGKGSTLAFTRAILEAEGYKVHVHTSPHLVNWYERYRLAGTYVSNDVLADAIERVSDANGGQAITIFEIMSAVMFVLFSEHEADFSLVEVGLGGRFDATNVIENPLVSAITPIALDHQAYLGDTIAKIAFEKAGIIKPGRPVVVSVQEEDARDTIENVASEKYAPIKFAGQDFDFYRDATGFVYQDEEGLLDLPMPALAGQHQMANAALAIAAIRSAEIEISDEAFVQGLKSVTWPGRLEKLPSGKIKQALGGHSNIWIDGGHNPSAGEVIAAELARQSVNGRMKLLMICGMINTKEPVGYFKPFEQFDVEVLTVPFSMSDADIAPDELAGYAKEAGLKAEAMQSLDEAIIEAEMKIKSESDLRVLFCGSLYMVGEVLAMNETPPK